MGNAKKGEKPSVSVNAKAKQPKRYPQKGQNLKGPFGNKMRPYNKFKEAEKASKRQKIEDRKAAKAEKIAEAEAQRERAIQEKEERIRNYKKKRLEKTKAISKKTHRGQPLMKDRMQLLLKQIQEMKHR